jgi:hypothetical protein
MPDPKNINELLEGGGGRLQSLKLRLKERSRVLAQVLEALPAELAGSVASAGVQDEELTIGAVNAAWATRLRYVTDVLQQRVSAALGLAITRVRIRVQPDPAPRAMRTK